MAPNPRPLAAAAAVVAAAAAAAAANRFAAPRLRTTPRLVPAGPQDGCDSILQRCSFSLMEALQEGLLALHDFEALITYLKVQYSALCCC